MRAHHDIIRDASVGGNVHAKTRSCVENTTNRNNDQKVLSKVVGFFLFVCLFLFFFVFCFVCLMVCLFV